MSKPEVRCNLVVIRSSDLERAEKFYSALGLTFTRHSHGNGPIHLASEQAGQVFEIYPVEKTETEPRPHESASPCRPSMKPMRR